MKDINKRVRRLKKEDIPFTFEIEEKSFSHPWSKEDMINSLENDHALCLGVFEEKEDKEELTGYIFSTFAGEDLSLGGESEIATIAVKEERRNEGFGELLLNTYLEEGKRLNIKKFSLEVRKSNLSAIALYKKAGYKIVSERKDFYRDPMEDAYIMTREEINIA